MSAGSERVKYSTSSWEPPPLTPGHHVTLPPTPHVQTPQQPMMAPRQSPHVAPRTPRSPNYFGLVVDRNNDILDSNDPNAANNKWSPPSSTIRSVAATSPKNIPFDANPAYAAFRKQSESNSFSLGHGNLTHFSRQSPSPRSSDDQASRPSLHAPSSSSSDESQPDQMEVDSIQPPTLLSPSPGNTSYFNRTPQQSPSSLTQLEGDRPSRSPLPQLDDGHRLSLPSMSLDPPSPHHLGPHSQRSATLPLSFDKNSPVFITPEQLKASHGLGSHQLMLLDLRVNPQYMQSRIRGALNLCIPTTLLKRPSFNLKKLADTFTDPTEKARFENWKENLFIVVYDEKSSQLKDAAACVNTIKKFTCENWNGKACILEGGFRAFAKRFPDLIDQQKATESLTPARNNLSIAPPVGGPAPVVGGCPMPKAQSAANPFFGNIRQNMDLIGGVGQLALHRPHALTEKTEAALPAWLREVAREGDEGRTVADKFLKIERAEQHRMQDALSCSVSYGSPKPGAPLSVQIAGIEKGGKNRYNNIWPYDHARVKLQGKSQGECDYINASFVKSRWSRKRYIATQGPLPATYEDFWTAIWEQDVRVVVMLTAESEGGQLKCHPYWKGREFGQLRLKPLSEKRVSLEPASPSGPPSGERPTLGKRRTTNPAAKISSAKSTPQVESPSPSDPPHVIIRKFTLAHSAHPFVPMREITQLQYSSWPDFGAPAHPSHVLSLVDHCNAVVRSTGSPKVSPNGTNDLARPILVHCSAGCGRTGTFCTVDTVIDMLKQQQSAHTKDELPSPTQMQASRSNKASPAGSPSNWLFRNDQDLVAHAVEEFRDQRLSMVQSLRQFVLCYETVLEWLVAQQAGEGKGENRSSSGGSSRRSYG